MKKPNYVVHQRSCTRNKQSSCQYNVVRGFIIAQGVKFELKKMKSWKGEPDGLDVGWIFGGFWWVLMSSGGEFFLRASLQEPSRTHMKPTKRTSPHSNLSSWAKRRISGIARLPHRPRDSSLRSEWQKKPTRNPQELTKEIKECSEFKEFKERTQIPNFTNLPNVMVAKGI